MKPYLKNGQSKERGGYSSGLEHLTVMHGALSFITVTTKKKKKRGKKQGGDVILKYDFKSLSYAQ